MKTITIYGRPVSKKNSKQVFHKHGKYIVIPSKAYKNFAKEAGMQLLRHARTRFAGELRIEYEFYQKGKMRQDFDNAIASINDILQEYGVIVDDKDILEGGYKVICNAPDWKTVVKIAQVNEENNL